MGVLLMVIAAFYGYFTFCDYLTKWYGSVKINAELIDAHLGKSVEKMGRNYKSIHGIGAIG